MAGHMFLCFIEITFIDDKGKAFVSYFPYLKRYCFILGMFWATHFNLVFLNGLGVGTWVGYVPRRGERTDHLFRHPIKRASTF